MHLGSEGNEGYLGVIVGGKEKTISRTLGKVNVERVMPSLTTGANEQPCGAGGEYGPLEREIHAPPRHAAASPPTTYGSSQRNEYR